MLEIQSWILSKHCRYSLYTLRRVRINYRRDLQNHIFTNTEQKYLMLQPFERGNVCSFIVTLNTFDVRPSYDTADVQAILPFPPNPLEHVLCDVPDCGVDALSQFWWCLRKWRDVNIVLDETPQEEITHLILSFHRVLYVVCFLLGNSPASEF